MSSREEILKYINNEIEISNYKISIINRNSSISPSKRRILEIEKEFLSLPLKDMGFESVSDVAAAISIYRSSRGLFYKTYKIDRPKEVYESKSELKNNLEKKINFIKEIANELIQQRVQEVNLVQNATLHDELIKIESLKNNSSIKSERKRLGGMTPDQLLELEPISMAKKRARIQSSIFSMGVYLLESLRNIIYNENSIDSLRYAISNLDFIIYNIKENIFKNYNISIDYLYGKKLGMGSNPYSGKIHKLQNILDFNNISKANYPTLTKNGSNFVVTTPQVGYVNFLSKSPIYNSLDEDRARKTKNKAYGIIFPIPRKGNEKMTLLYKSIFSNKKRIDDLFCNSLSNVKAKDGSNKLKYFKAILIEPLWEILDSLDKNDDFNNLISEITKIDNIKTADLNDKLIIDKINSSMDIFLPIDGDSKILTAKTRSEEDGISEIIPMLHSMVDDIIKDYELMFDTTNDIYLD